MAIVRWHLVALLIITTTTRTMAIDQNKLATLVDEILHKFKVQTKMPMFSMAVSVPPGADPGTYDLTKVSDLGQNVKNTILQCGIYAGDNVVAATLLRWPDVVQRCPRAEVPWQDVLKACRHKSMTWHEVAMICPGAVEGNRADHAEYRVLERFDSWADDKDKSGLLVLYVYTAPCESRCASERNVLSILKLLERIRDWKEYVLVFSKLLNVKTLWAGNSMPDKRLARALLNLGRHLGRGGLGKIFRCDQPEDANTNAMECISCSTGGEVTPQCYKKESHQDPWGQSGASAVRGELGNAQGVSTAAKRGSASGGAIGRGQGGSENVRKGEGWAPGVGGTEGEWQTVGQGRQGAVRMAQEGGGAARGWQKGGREGIRRPGGGRRIQGGRSVSKVVQGAEGWVQRGRGGGQGGRWGQTAGEAGNGGFGGRALGGQGEIGAVPAGQGRGRAGSRAVHGGQPGSWEVRGTQAEYWAVQRGPAGSGAGEWGHGSERVGDKRINWGKWGG